MKTPAKKATKATGKAPAKVAAPAKKVSAKSPSKAKTVAVQKTAVTAKAKPASAKKAVPKTNAKPKAKAPVKAPVKALAKKPAAKPVAKAPAKALLKKAVPVKAAPAQAAGPKKPVAVPKSPDKVLPPKVAKPAKVAKTPAPQPQSTPVVAVAESASAELPIRSSRPSARLAQITVPSMPQAVASTAAKATFLPSMSTAVLPVPAAAVKKDPKLANNWKNKPVEQLSDAEVLAMPDAEYMNDVQMAFFRLKLVLLKQDILSNAGETTEHLREDTVVVPDPADRATIEEEHALELRTRDRERKLLKKIEQSIVRIDAGDYGYCDETGEPIGVGRLLARPTATLSLEAQQRRELKQKMFGD